MIFAQPGRMPNPQLSSFWFFVHEYYIILNVLLKSVDAAPFGVKIKQVTELLNSLLARFMLQYGNWHDRPFSSCVRAHVGELDEL